MENAPRFGPFSPGKGILYQFHTQLQNRCTHPVPGEVMQSSSSPSYKFPSTHFHVTFQEGYFNEKKKVKKILPVFCLVHYSHLRQQSRCDHVPRDTPNLAQDGAPASNSSPISVSKAIITLIPQSGLWGNSSLVCHGYPLRRVCTFPYVLSSRESLN